MSLLDLFQVNLQVLLNHENNSLTCFYDLTHYERKSHSLALYVSLTIQIIKPLLLGVLFFVLIPYKAPPT